MEFIDDMAEQTEKKEKEYLLPDGFGLSLEQVKNLINQQCGISIKNDDPIMCIVPILNAFLHEQKKQNETYAAALEKVYQQVLTTFLEELDKRLQNGDLKVTVNQNSFADSFKKFFDKNFIIYLLLGMIFLQAFLMAWFLGR